MNFMYEIGLIIVVATTIAFLMKWLKQPLILAYVLAGVIIGPLGAKLISNNDAIIISSEMGIAFLLFIVGLEININRLKEIKFSPVIAGIAQVVSAAGISFFAARLLGFSTIQSVYLALALSFSSTMIVVKLMSDKRELDTLHGRIMVGILLVQDVIAIIALTLLANLNEGDLAKPLLAGMVLFFLTILSSKYFLPAIFRSAARSQELLFLASVSWCFFFSILASMMGYSVAIGAFLAGISLASTNFSLEIISKVKSLKDFFATIFFVALGMQIIMPSTDSLKNLSLMLIPLVWTPLVIMTTLSILGYKKITSFLTASSLAQISEFSLIIIALGYATGAVSQEIVSLIALITVVTITITSYVIKFDHAIYKKISTKLSVFEKLSKGNRQIEYLPDRINADVILAGYNRIGYSVYKALKKMNKKLIIVDFNPELINSLACQKIPCIYGDVSDEEILDRLNLKKIQMLISTVPGKQDNLFLIKKTKDANKKAIMIVTANHTAEALELYEAGADYVILPHFLGGDHVSFMLQKFISIDRIIKNRLEHIKDLNERRALGHEHPEHR